MNEEYLWNKSGEPDPEIQKLEQILGTLRYQPKPLDLGNEVQIVRRNRYVPLMTIAATLLIALIAGALWLRVRNKTTPQLHNAGIGSSSVPQEVNSPVPTSNEHVATAPRKRDPEHSAIKIMRHSRVKGNSNMTAREREQALEAKEQLMMALRLASEKLNFAQRKAQGPSPNQIKNQHKIG